MIRLIVIFLSASALTYSQEVDSLVNSLYKDENVIKFADYLFCQKDYLRAANEYLRLNKKNVDEKINFKIALSFSVIGNYPSAKRYFDQIEKESPLFSYSKLERMKILFLEEKYSELKNYLDINGNKNTKTDSPQNKIYFISLLRWNQNLPSLSDFIKTFDITEQNEAVRLYRFKQDSPKKNPVTASILSALLPGAGKFYTGDIGDGIFAFISTSLFSFLAYDNFKANHDFRGWLFAGLAAGFYGGNIYGSYASAQILNVKIQYEFNFQLDSFIKSKNYFIPEYDFCK